MNHITKITLFAKSDKAKANMAAIQRGIQIQFKESRTVPRRNLGCLQELFERNGLRSKEVEQIERAPFFWLCVYCEGLHPQLSLEEVRQILEKDKEIDLSQVGKLQD